MKNKITLCQKCRRCDQHEEIYAIYLLVCAAILVGASVLWYMIWKL